MAKEPDCKAWLFCYYIVIILSLCLRLYKCKLFVILQIVSNESIFSICCVLALIND